MYTYNLAFEATSRAFLCRIAVTDAQKVQEMHVNVKGELLAD